MTYVVTKIIKGNPYLYEVRSEREGDRVRQVFVRYLGRVGSAKAEARAAEIGMEEAPERRTPAPRRTTTSPIDTEATTWYRGLLPERAVSETGEYYSSSKEVAEEYAAAAKVGGKEGKMRTLQTPQLTGKFYETTNKEQLAEDLDIETDPFRQGVEFDKAVIDKLSKQGYSGVHYTTGTFEEEELHVFPKKAEPQPIPEAVTRTVEEKVEPEPEIISTPAEAKDYIIKKEPEPFLPSGFKYMVYQSDNTPMYISGDTPEEAASKLKQGHEVASVKVEGEQEVTQLKELGWSDSRIAELDQAERASIIRNKITPEGALEVTPPVSEGVGLTKLGGL